MTPFNWRHEPYDHQRDCFMLSKDSEYYGLLFDMGCGKSKTLLDTISYLYQRGLINGVVIMAPAGPYDDWADKHIPEHLWEGINHKVITWRATPPKYFMDDLRKMAAAEAGCLHILVVNVEAMISELPVKVAKYFLSHHNAMFAVDESTVIGNPDAARTKTILDLAPLAAYRRIMTGDTAPNSPLTVFSQCEFLKPGVLGHRSYFGFKAEFCQQVPMTTRAQKTDEAGNTKTVERKFKQITGFQNLEKLTEKMKDFCFIVKAEDCLDLPKKVYEEHYYQMGPKQAACYEQMRQTSVAFLEAHIESARPVKHAQPESFEQLQMFIDAFEHQATPSTPDQGVGAGPVSTAALVITQMLRLHQIACGFLALDDKTEVSFDEPNPQIARLLELTDTCERGAIIWCNYRRNIHEVAAALSAKYGPETVVTYYGDTKREQRRQAKKDFQDLESPVKWWVSNPSTGKWGLTLTATDREIYYSNNFDQEARAQSEKRAHRIGQKYDVTFQDLIGRGTIAEKILKVLKAKKRLSEVISPSNWRRLFDAG